MEFTNSIDMNYTSWSPMR